MAANRPMHGLKRLPGETHHARLKCVGSGRYHRHCAWRFATALTFTSSQGALLLMILTAVLPGRRTDAAACCTPPHMHSYSAGAIIPTCYGGAPDWAARCCAARPVRGRKISCFIPHIATLKAACHLFIFGWFPHIHETIKLSCCWPMIRFPD